MNILALSWRDIKSNAHGGAEVLTHQLLKAAVEAGIKVVHLAPMEEGLEARETIDGVVYRRAGRVSNIIATARSYYKKHQNQIDYVIDQCNTFRFFTKFWVPKEKRIFMIWQLTREIWDINMKPPISWVGKVAETPMLRLNKDDTTITESESTKEDLVKIGFKPEKVHVVPICLDDSLLNRNVNFEKEKAPNFIFVGRYSKYKGINVSIEALAEVKKTEPKAKLWVVGKKDEQYISEVLEPLCCRLELSIGDAETNDVVTWGFVSEDKKHELMADGKALIFPSIREGWGMIITEAAALGTPSITYDAPGTRDAVDFGNAGYLCNNKSAEGISSLMKECIANKEKYDVVQKEAYHYANLFTYERTKEKFLSVFK
ncbi:MAG: glycosyltransferase family 4 protein [Lachnospiraceae bacterium]|nr:glycosyltransferase family 4 protein [Lachnospiraceae bacterium]